MVYKAIKLNHVITLTIVAQWVASCRMPSAHLFLLQTEGSNGPQPHCQVQISRRPKERNPILEQMSMAQAATAMSPTTKCHKYP